MTTDRARPLASLVLLFVAPLVVGALLAPHAAAFLAWLGQHVDLGPHLANPKFKRVLSRCVMLTALVLLYPAIRMSGLTSAAALGWPRQPNRWSVIARWYGAGVASMLLIYVASNFLGALCFQPRSTGWLHALGKWTGLFVGSVFIGIFEETFFRGYVFGVFRKALRFWPAAAAASLLFAAVHLMRPAAPEGMDTTHWAAGFRMLPHVLDGFQMQYFWPTMTNLFLMSLLFCILYNRMGSIYAAIGLHGGWVWAMGVGNYLFDRNGDRLNALFGASETVSMTWMGTVVIAVFLATALVLPLRKAENVGAK